MLSWNSLMWGQLFIIVSYNVTNNCFRPFVLGCTSKDLCTLAQPLWWSVKGHFNYLKKFSLSTQTIINHLHEVNLHARRPKVVVPLTRQHKTARRQWAQNHVTWTQWQWHRVLFTDESKFCVDSNDGRRRVWRLPGERLQPANLVEHDRYGNGSVMVWAGISEQSKTPLHFIDNGTLTGVRYRDEILDAYVRPLAANGGNNFIFMDDNARAHRARIVTGYLRAHNIEHMDLTRTFSWSWPEFNFFHPCQ